MVDFKDLKGDVYLISFSDYVVWIWGYMDV